MYLEAPDIVTSRIIASTCRYLPKSLVSIDKINIRITKPSLDRVKGIAQL